MVRDTLRACRRTLHDYGFPENIVLVPDVRESDAIGWEPLVDSLTDS